MDGILSGLTSIMPVLPDQSTIITDRSGANKPPVEIMPLPSNSFMSDDASAELLKNPFTLSLDKNRHGGDDSTSGKAVSRPGVQSNRTAPSDDTGVVLNEAYTLSLGNEENVPIATEIAREMTRMRNYELLGKTAARHTYRKNPETGTVEQTAVQPQTGDPKEQIAEKVRSLLSQVSTQLNDNIAQTAQNGEITTRAQMENVFLTRPDILPEAAAGPQLALQPAGESAEAGVRQDLSLLSSLAGLQLSVSDIEVVLALEPELQEALLNMLSSVNADIASRPAAKQEELSYGITADKTAAQTNMQDGPETGKNVLIKSQPGAIQQALNDISKHSDRVRMMRTTDLPDNARAIALTDNELTRLAVDTLAVGRGQGASPGITLPGDMANLRKVNELPYSLYIFGSVNTDRKYDSKEDEIAVSDESGKARTGSSQFLRISEVIRMAAVLHNIYYGGSGRFPEDTPWYIPYVRYAIKNGIINNDEFSDYNDYATKAETAYIFSNCVPEAEFPIINYVSDLKDVTETFGYGDSIYLLYRAGVLRKAGKNASFYPERMITRTEAATIIGRIASPEDRKLF
jgi:hypothetical protein